MTHLIFFDETCRFCRRSVATLLKMDPKGHFFYAPLGGVNAARLLPPELREENSLILAENAGERQEKIWLRGRAFFRILWIIGGVWKSIGWLYHFRMFDPIYRLIAKMRHHLSAKENEEDIFNRYKERFWN